MAFFIRQIQAADLDEVRRLYCDTINLVNSKDYNAEQVMVWSSGWENTERWLNRLATQYFIVADTGTQLAGISSLSPEGYLDVLYVHHAWQGKGVASALLINLEQKAREQGNTIITTDASITARPFFERRGFAVLQQQTVNVKGVDLTNFKMAKTLAV
jgi:putative acetyltransferase